MTWQITAKTGERRGVSWSIGEHPLTLGRSLSCDITIADPTVSRRHCEIAYDGGRVRFRDLGSRNVTLVNGRVVDECYLDVGDELSLGEDAFIVTRGALEPATAPTLPHHTDDTTVSLRSIMLAPEDENLSHATLGYPATPHDMIQLYQFSQRLQRVHSEHEFATLCLLAAQERFPEPAKAAICFKRAGQSFEICPRGSSFPDHTLKHIDNALHSGRSTLKQERKRALRAARQVCISPLFVNGSATTALVVTSAQRNHLLDKADLARLDALANMAALHLTALSQRTAFVASEPDEDLPLEFLGKSDDAAQLRKEIKEAAKTRLNTLITGEAGTGKSLAAQLIHHRSPQPHGALISVNCENISGSNFPKTLLGEERLIENGGRIIDAGLLDQANGGTLLLREIDALTMENQQLLAHTLGCRAFIRVGSSGEVSFHGRLIVTSRTNIESLVQEDRFRAELFKRISRQRLHITPLRQRRGDIRALAKHFLRGEKRRPPQHGGGLTEEALGYLEELPLWGNARELRKSISHAAQIENKNRLQSHDFGSHVSSVTPLSVAPLDPLENAEQILIAAVIRQCSGDTTRAAHILGITRLEVERVVGMKSGSPKNGL